MHVTLRWFRSGIGLALLFVVLLAGGTLAIVSVPDHLARAVGGSIFAVGALAAATRALLSSRRRGSNADD